MKKTLAKKVIDSRVCPVLAFLMAMFILFLTSPLDAYAADNEPKDLRWDEYRPYRAEWGWTDGDKYPDKVDITVKYASPDGEETDTFTYPDCNYLKNNGSYIDFNDSGDSRFFDSHGEGYYSFYLDVYYAGQTDPSRIACDGVYYREVGFNTDIRYTGSPVSVDWDVSYSTDQQEDAHYYIPARDPSVLPADKTVRVRANVREPGFNADGFAFEPVPEGLSVSDAGDKASFTLDTNTVMTVKIVQDVRTVPVTIDFGEGHEDVAEATAEKIKSPDYLYDPSYDASVSGSLVTVPEWPQATKVKDLKDLISKRIHEAYTPPGFSDVYDDSECFDGKIGRKSMTAYSGQQEYLTENESDQTADTPEGGLELYVLWDKPLREAAYTIEAPACGTVITKTDEGKQSPAPVVTPEEGCPMGVDGNTGPLWYKDGSFFTGTIKGEETYTVQFGVKAPFGYYFGTDPGGGKLTLKINGTEIPNYYGAVSNSFDIWAAHDWGEWTVTDPATEKEDGEKTRTCIRCSETEKQVIPRIKPIVTMSASTYTWNGKVKRPTVTVKNGSTKLAASQYKVTYAPGRKNVGKYSVKVTLRGNYSGTKTVTFKINPKGTSISKLTKAKKAATVKWKKQSAKMSTSRITGYQIRLATNEKFTKNRKTVTVKGYSKTSGKVTKLKGGKKYYVKIRTYKTVSGTKYYSPWSKVKTVTTKK